jgi:hypothetical protein
MPRQAIYWIRAQQSSHGSMVTRVASRRGDSPICTDFASWDREYHQAKRAVALLVGSRHLTPKPSSLPLDKQLGNTPATSSRACVVQPAMRESYRKLRSFVLTRNLCCPVPRAPTRVAVPDGRSSLTCARTASGARARSSPAAVRLLHAAQAP